MVSVNFIDLGELAYANYQDGYLRLSLYAAVEFIEETILVAKARKRIDIAL